MEDLYEATHETVNIGVLEEDGVLLIERIAGRRSSPLGTAIGQAYGWRSPFWVVALLGVASIAGLMIVLPKGEEVRRGNLAREISALRGAGLTVERYCLLFVLLRAGEVTKPSVSV